jgi:HNH endonuclease
MGRPQTLTAIERFESHFIPEPNSGCWLWLGFVPDDPGYGQFTEDCVEEKRSEGAHRYSFRVHKGPIPDGLMVCHSCDVPSCVNPDHLFVGTHTDNMRDASRKGRLKWKNPERPALRRGESHPGHKLTEEEVREIRTSPERSATLARRLGVSKTLIGRIRKRLTWKDI